MRFESGGPKWVLALPLSSKQRVSVTSWLGAQGRVLTKFLAHGSTVPGQDACQVCRNGSHAMNIGCIVVHSMHSLLYVFMKLGSEAAYKHGERATATFLLSHAIGVIASEDIISGKDPIHELPRAFLCINPGMEQGGLANGQLLLPNFVFGGSRVAKIFFGHDCECRKELIRVSYFYMQGISAV